MHEHIPVIRNDPLAERKTINAERLQLVFVLDARLEFVGNRLQLRLGCSGTDNEKIGERGEFAQVEDYNVLGLLVCGDAGAKPCEFF